MNLALAAARLASFAVLGLAFGSFMTVVVHRMPRKESVFAPRSRCPSCGEQLLSRDNVPLLSYVLLRGRCRWCDSRVSAQYPLVEAITGALFLLVALRFQSTWRAALMAPFLAVLVGAAIIDIRHRIIPNALVLPSVVIFGAAVLAVAAAHQASLVDAALGLLAFGGALLLLAIASPGGMGLGDVKLGALIGLGMGALGWAYVGVAAFAAVAAGGLGATAALLRGKSRKDTIPFGPYLAVGALVAAFLAPQAASLYGSFLR
jgi:leader peptidase (prepilin peptidase)/N-methyltransferase